MTWLLSLCLFVGSENLGIGRVNERAFIWSFEIKRKVRRKMRGKWVGSKEREREREDVFVLFCFSGFTILMKYFRVLISLLNRYVLRRHLADTRKGKIKDG